MGQTELPGGERKAVEGGGEPEEVRPHLRRGAEGQGGRLQLQLLTHTELPRQRQDASTLFLLISGAEDLMLMDDTFQAIPASAASIT